MRCEVIRYSGKDRRKEDNLKLIVASLAGVSILPVKTITFDIDELSEFVEYLHSLCRDVKGCRAVTVDITTFTKKYLLILLNVLRQELPEATLRLLYAPGVYASKSHLSWGVKNLSTVPFLGGMSAIESDKKLLVLFLGYERERAWSILNYIEPDETVAVIANPPTHPGDEYPSRTANKRILERRTTNERCVSALRPADTTNLLNDLYRSPSYQDYMLYISPLGTKMEAVGVYTFFESNHPADRAQVVYASPVIYNHEKYTFTYDGEVVEHILPPRIAR